MQSSKHVAHIAEPIKHNLLAIEVKGFSLARAIIDFPPQPQQCVGAGTRHKPHGYLILTSKNRYNVLPLNLTAQCAMQPITQQKAENRKALGISALPEPV